MAVSTGGLVEQVVLTPHRVHFESPQSGGGRSHAQLRSSDNVVRPGLDDQTRRIDQAITESRCGRRNADIVQIQHQRFAGLHVEAVGRMIFFQGLEAWQGDGQPTGSAELQVVMSLGDRSATDAGLQTDHLAAGEGAQIDRSGLLPTQTIQAGFGRRVGNRHGRDPVGAIERVHDRRLRVVGVHGHRGQLQVQGAAVCQHMPGLDLVGLIVAHQRTANTGSLTPGRSIGWEIGRRDHHGRRGDRDGHGRHHGIQGAIADLESEAIRTRETRLRCIGQIRNCARQRSIRRLGHHREFQRGTLRILAGQKHRLGLPLRQGQGLPIGRRRLIDNHVVQRGQLETGEFLHATRDRQRIGRNRVSEGR